MFFEMRFDLGTLDSGERSLPFGLLVKKTGRRLALYLYKLFHFLFQIWQILFKPKFHIFATNLSHELHFISIHEMLLVSRVPICCIRVRRHASGRTFVNMLSVGQPKNG